jgi:hypothetical protein
MLILVPAIPLRATSYRGIQAPLFSAWNDASVDKLIETVAAAQDKLPANRFEIALMYMTNDLPEHADGTERGRWDNVRRVLDCLATVPALPGVTCPVTPSSAIDVKIRVFFDLHQFAGKTESEDLDILKKRAAEFNSMLFASYGNRIVFRLSPLLEEDPAVNFTKFAQAVVGKLDAAKVCSSIYPRLIRSRNGATSPSSVTVSLKCPDRSKAVNKAISVSMEWHGGSPRSGYDSWSNDGVYVYQPSIEDGTLTANADGTVDPVKLADFIKDANSKTLTALIWRPRYNLTLYKKSAKAPACQNSPPDKQKLAYCASGAERKSIADRIEATKGAVFDDVEADILKSFLTTMKN